MRKTELHYPDKGVNASWAHACGHLSNPVWYESTAEAEARREEMESASCWECRQAVPVASEG